MQIVFWDIIKADVLAMEYMRDSQKVRTGENIALQKRIFQFHNISHEQFNNSMKYYSERPVQFTAMLDSMIARQGRINDSASKRILKDE